MSSVLEPVLPFDPENSIAPQEKKRSHASMAEIPEIPVTEEVVLIENTIPFLYPNLSPEETIKRLMERNAELESRLEASMSNFDILHGAYKKLQSDFHSYLVNQAVGANSAGLRFTQVSDQAPVPIAYPIPLPAVSHGEVPHV